MIGTRITGTLWVVVWQHQPLDKGADGGVVSGHMNLVTADPSGADLYEVAKAAVLNGKASTDVAFSVLRAERLCEVRGTAIVGGGGN